MAVIVQTLTVLLMAWHALAATTTTAPAHHHRRNYRTVCYYAGWARYRADPVTFHPEDVDTGLCTHVVFAFANVSTDGLHIVPADLTDPPVYKRLTDLKREKPKLDVLLSVGGWNLGSAEFSTLVSSQDNMHVFAGNVIEFLHEYNFDGLDMDWEYPAARGSPPEDKHRFTTLMQTLHSRFVSDHRVTHRNQLILTAAISADPGHLRNSYELQDVAKTVDFFNLMTYDMHGAWETTLGHHSPLFSVSEDETDSIDYQMKFLLGTNITASKFNLGIGLYGRTFNLTNPTNHAVGAPISGSGARGPLTGEEGFLAYYEICKILTENPDGVDVTSGRLSGTNTPFMVDGNRWTGYEDIVSLKEKVDYVVQNDLGGLMIWGIDLDDFHGICGQGHYPLLHAIQNRFHHPGIIG